ncbi:hypothetical protein AGDE_09060 [Angomonas deanei]|uniref:Leucine Rich repeat, putative n=1 Tax=Angomonas deanei TaxID=59799 RepID=A0A7G2C567_9TRYP|nr:hypothetical protein AGDE_09060 [Angomonas deanei]CAD2214958.1 Leucine Rich repeat, putative [Angomonas deanei]|eukprot:EPY31422.1 hypothetical protein AGDE_09060 [Angomonas deanei]
MHTQPRSDLLEVRKSKFALPHCERASTYFDQSYMQNPLRRLRLQISCSGPSGMNLLFPKMFHHWQTLRLLDLSRNNLDTDDIVNLCNGMKVEESSSPLEVLDLSYNCRIGNSGAVHILQRTMHSKRLRAVLLKCTGVDDRGAVALHPFLKSRPVPEALPEGVEPIRTDQCSNYAHFYLNLNENFIGSVGTDVLGKQLPAYISLTVTKQKYAKSLP